MGNYFSPEKETASREQITQWQTAGFLDAVKRVYENVPYYREKMEEKGVTPDDIKDLSDLSKLPFLTKDDLREAYPYGLMARPLSDCVRIHSTSGTTGRRVVAFYTENDVRMWDECCARALVAAGGTKDDVVQVSYGFGLFTGGAGLNGGSHMLGSLTLPMSSGNTDRQIQFMTDLGATILCCTPSYAAYLAESINERGVRDRIRLKAGIFGAEAWTEEMRHDIEKALGLGEVLPYGEKGELVFTSFAKEAFPLIRYRTKDIGILNSEKCSCGRTFVRMTKPLGRSDDMLIVKGVNVFPSQIETVLLNHGYAANYQIVVDRVNNSDTIEVRVEMTPEMFSDEVGKIRTLEKDLVNGLKSMLGIYANVRLVAPKSITRSEGKAVRVIDKRNLYKG